MKIFALSMVIFMIPSRRPVVHMVSCKMIENGYYVFKRLLTSAWVFNYATCFVSSWCIALLWILISCGRHPRTIFVMIYNIVSSIPFIFQTLPRIRSMIMDYTS